MATSTTIPITVDPEAAALVAELGLEAAFQEMLDHARQDVPNLKQIEVECAFMLEDSDDPRVNLILVLSGSGDIGALSREERRWDSWAFHTYPVEVFRHFLAIFLDDPS